ncbi:MAG: DUF4388 domain-containing protein [Acidobacteriota bacterium]
MIKSGQLKQIPFGEVLRAFLAAPSPGCFVVRNHSGEKQVFLEPDLLAYATSSFPEDGLGQVLQRTGRLTLDQLRELEGLGGREQIQLLIEKGILQTDELRESLHAQIQQVFFSLFEWSSGEFQFLSQNAASAGHPDLSLPLRSLVFEGIRRLQNKEILHRGLRGEATRITLATDFEALVAGLALTPDEGFILSRVESGSTISEILQISPLGIEPTQRALYGFICTGILQFVEAQKSQVSPASGQGVMQSNESAPLHNRRPSVPSQPDLTYDAPPVQDELEAMRGEISEMLERSKSQNYYDLLSVPVTASLDEIKKSYYALAKKYHPDRFHQAAAEDIKQALDSIFSTLSHAYDTLKVPATRTSYDARIFKLDTPAAGTAESGTAGPPPGTPTPQQKLAELNYRQGRGLYDQQDYWGAIQALRQSVRMDPDNHRYRYWLAMALSKNPKWRREAEEHFLKAIEKEQFNASYYVGLALLYKEVGMNKRAEAQARQALEVNPSDVAANELLRSLAQPKEAKGLKSLKNIFRLRK